MSEVNLKVNFCDIEFSNPVLTASGTYGFGLEYDEILSVKKLGGIATKGLTPEARAGNPGVRLHETPAGLLNSIGLENPGVDSFIANYLPKSKRIGTKIIANISGNSLEEYAYMSEKLNKVDGISALEVNISCPNVKAGGMAFGTSADMAAQVTRAVKSNSKLPVIMKLSPNVTNIVEIALAVEDAGADALSMINTLLGMSIDIKTQKPVLGNLMGGLSGPAIKPVGVRMVWQVAQAVKLPIIGMGGINSWQDAIEYILAGANLIMVGTANFTNPLLPLEIISGLEKYLRDNGFSDINDIVGLAYKGGINNE